MNKKTKILIGVIAAITVVAATLGALLIPRTGKRHVEIWSAGDDFVLSDIPTVEKEPGKPFRIMIFADLQLWSDLGANQKVFELMDELVAEADPDLIVTVGDNVSGLTTDMLTRRLVKKMDSYGIPWAPTFGNHDAEGNATLNWQGDRFEEAEHCLFRKGPSNLYGVGNYAVNIVEGDRVVETLFFFDNGRYYKYANGKKSEIYMGYEQIAWYRWNVEGIAAATGAVVPSMTFSHFSMPQFTEAIRTLATKGEDGYYYVPEELGYGYCKYLPASAPVDSGFIRTAKELGSTTHVFSGHDHENNASILYDGITYTYGLKTGCSPKPWNDADYYGATVIEIDGGVTLSEIRKSA